MPSPTRHKLRKREIALAIGIGGIASFAAAGILTDGFGGPGYVEVQEEIVEETERTYQVGEFDRVSTSGPQNVQIAYGDSYSVRAEGPNGDLEVVVVGGELIIRHRDGFDSDWQKYGETTLFVTMPQLSRLAMTGSGDIHVEQLKGERFVAVLDGGFGGSFEIDAIDVEEAEFTINGRGEIAASGLARSARVTINGSGEFQAGDLRSQAAVVAVRGSGEVELAAEREADVSVQGSGHVDIDGPARCTVSTSGSGSISCGGGESD